LGNTYVKGKHERQVIFEEVIISLSCTNVLKRKSRKSHENEKQLNETPLLVKRTPFKH